MEGQSMTKESATLAAGCFWCIEAAMDQLAGVESVESGYIGGETANPSYQQICTGTTGHAEAVRITFDPAKITYDDLLEIFFHLHDPTQLNRQGNDVGTQYRSAIFPHSPEQEAAARAAIARVQQEYDRPVVTTIEPLATWYPAEDYHQEYVVKDGGRNPYCRVIVDPKLAKFRKSYADRLKSEAGAEAR
jgi:peptide-methionine (S)-S-oxide reductase